MRKVLFAAVGLFMVVAMAMPALAAPKFVNAIPSCDRNGNVIIPTLPTGATLLNVFVYDDVQGTLPKSLGPVFKFKLKADQGFNFFWKDQSGNWFQMITPVSVARGLVTDCSNSGGCKYLYPGK